MADGRPSALDQTVVLRDGRRLGFAEWGDGAGRPVFFFHGLPSSRLNGHADAAVLAAKRARWIAIDRPGIGLSDFQPQRTLLDWPDDVVQLADSLGFERFAVVGLSGGGPYAAACAYKIPGRLTRVGIVSGLAPIDRLPAEVQRRRRVSRFRYLRDRATTAAMAAAGRRWPDWTYRQTIKGMPEPDRIVASQPEAKKARTEAFLEAVRTGTRGVAYDGIVLYSPWGFELEEITAVEVMLWHGDEDKNVPISRAKILAEAIPNARLTVNPGAGHLLIDTNFEQILEAIIGSAD